MDEKGTALLAELKRRNLGPEAVKAIFLTHATAITSRQSPLQGRRHSRAAGDVPLVEAPAAPRALCRRTSRPLKRCA